MSKKKSIYNVESNIDHLINIEIGKRMSVSGSKVLKSEIMQEIAEHSGVGKDNIAMIKRGVINPSLPVALRIADYFNLKIEDIFKITEK